MPQLHHPFFRSKPTLWSPVLFCGVAGASFSVLMRLNSLSWSPRIAAHFKDLEAMRRDLLIDCLLSITRGAFTAGIVYLLFKSGLLKGALFPEFKPNAAVSDPYSPMEVAKLLVWAFVAGFAERFVPDKLNRLVGEASNLNEKK